MKNKLIIFEGVDKTGKSTLIKYFNDITNYKYWVLDRGPISSIVYDESFKRNNNQYWLNLIKELNDSFDLKIIYCDCENEIIEKRLKNNNEILPEKLINIDKIKNMFLKYINDTNLNYVILDTTDKNINECLDEIIKFVEEN